MTVIVVPAEGELRRPKECIACGCIGSIEAGAELTQTHVHAALAVVGSANELRIVATSGPSRESEVVLC